MFANAVPLSDSFLSSKAFLSLDDNVCTTYFFLYRYAIKKNKLSHSNYVELLILFKCGESLCGEPLLGLLGKE